MAQKPKLPTVQQLAQAAGVSPATISRVLNHKGVVKKETYDKVLEALRACNYPFKEERAWNSGNNIIILNAPSLDNPFYHEIVRGAKAGALRYGYHLMVNEDIFNYNTLPRFLELIHKIKATGLITLNTIPPDILQSLSSEIMVVQCCEFDEEADLPYVSVDDFNASRNVAEHLLSLGCRRIAFLSGPPSYKYSRHRLRGYKHALRGAGIEPDPRLIVQFPEINYELSITSAMQMLRSTDPPDAFLTTSDVYAASVIRAAHLVGMRVPQDLKVTGFDNIDISSMTIPSITTVNQPKMRLGLMACELLIEKINDPESPNKNVLLETELIVRESTSL